MFQFPNAEQLVGATATTSRGVPSVNDHTEAGSAKAAGQSPKAPPTMGSTYMLAAGLVVGAVVLLWVLGTYGFKTINL